MRGSVPVYCLNRKYLIYRGACKDIVTFERFCRPVMTCFRSFKYDDTVRRFDFDGGDGL